MAWVLLNLPGRLVFHTVLLPVAPLCPRFYRSRRASRIIDLSENLRIYKNDTYWIRWALVGELVPHSGC